MTNTIDLLKKQIDAIDELRELPSSQGPKFKSWKQLTKSIIIKRLGGDKWQEFDVSCDFWPNRVGPWSSTELQQSLNQGLDTAKSLLETLIQETEIFGETMEKKEDAHHHKIKTDSRIFDNITISGGTVIFGDGNKITQVAVKELVEALSKEIEEKVPDGEEKRGVLQKLKKITTNETFASVAGTVIGEILKRVSH